MSRLRFNTKGFFIPFLALLLVGMLTVIALAIDTGHLLLANRKLQRAVDAATMSGARVYKARNNAFNDSRAELVMQEALRTQGLSVEPGQLIVSGERSTNPLAMQGQAFGSEVLSLSSALNVDLLLMDIFTGLNQPYQVTASAKAGTLPVNLGLVLDVSGSMDTPSRCSPGGTGECEPDRNGECPKICELRKAAINIVNLLDENADTLSIVTYSNSANIIKDINDPIVKADLVRMLNQLHPVQATCIACGLQDAREQMLLLGPRARSRHIILMTDGTPNKLPVGITEACGYSHGAYLADYPRIDEARVVHFYQTLIESYLLKLNGITLHTVGLGLYPISRIPNPCTARDPYNWDCVENPQEDYPVQADSPNAVRPNLLEQMAGAKNTDDYPESVRFEPRQNSADDTRPPFLIPDDEECSAISRNASDPRNELCACKTRPEHRRRKGRFYLTPNGDELNLIFETILFTIKEPRLII